jgi:hypothetical protein
VGCVSYGQARNADARKSECTTNLPSSRCGESRVLQVCRDRLVAPKGWNCEGCSDSSGWGMFLSPEPIEGEPGWPNFHGPAIDLQRITAENGFGRSQIAEAVSRVFPTSRPWAMRSMEGLGLNTNLPGGHYPTDRLKYRSSRVVEFETPPRKKGLSGDFSRMVPNDKPIYGVAILMGNPLGDLLVLSVRMPR